MWLSDGYGAHNKVRLQVRQCMSVCVFLCIRTNFDELINSVLRSVTLFQFSRAKRVKFIWWVAALLCAFVLSRIRTQFT